MFRQNGYHRIVVPSGASQTPLIPEPGCAAALIVVPAGFTAPGSASIFVGSDELGPWQLYEADGTTAVTINLVANTAVILPAGAMVTPNFRLAFAGATTREETLYVAHKS